MVPDAYSTIDQRGRRNTLDDTLDRSDRDAPQVNVHPSSLTHNKPNQVPTKPSLNSPAHQTNTDITSCFISLIALQRCSTLLTFSHTSFITHLFFNGLSLSLILCQSFSFTLREECMGRGGALCLCWTLMMVRPLPLPPTQCMSTHGMCVHLLHGLHVYI